MPPPHHTTTVDLHPLPGRRRPTTEALHALAQAERKRALGDDLQRLGDATGARCEHLEAQKLEDAARAVLQPTEMARPSTNGGEVAAYDYSDPADRNAGLHLLDSLRSPDMAQAQASLERHKLVMEIGCAELAQDLAATIAPTNSIERMLSAQLASAHYLALRFLALSQTTANTAAAPGEPYWREHNVEACRLTNAAARLLSSFHEGALTLHKLRTGNKQTVVVQHVRVSEGGQAVIAGDMTTGGGGLSAPGDTAEKGRNYPMHNNLVHAWKAPRCLAQTRHKTPCRGPALRRKRRCRLHGGYSVGAPRGNQYAVKHGRYSVRAMAQRRRARAERFHLQMLIQMARSGIDSPEAYAAFLDRRFAHLPPAEAQRGREAAAYFSALLERLFPGSMPLSSS